MLQKKGIMAARRAIARRSRNTVRQALAELERDGLIRREPGRETFVHDSALLQLMDKEGARAAIVPITVNEAPRPLTHAAKRRR